MNLPNAISLARLLSAPFIVWLILTGEMTLAFWTFFIAGVSDGADGFIAKRFGTTTVLGGYLDAIADKALLVSVYMALGGEGYIELWLVILVVFRDLLIVGGAVLLRLMTRTLSTKPMMISKINTVAQIVLAAVMLGNLGLGLPLDAVAGVLVYIVAATTLTSGASYLIIWTRRAATVESSE